MTEKTLLSIKCKTGGHWVGDGFPVSTMFSYFDDGQDISPFLLLDYAGPAVFEPADTTRGVGQHPHRGFETVTLVYHGEVEHRDNAGNSGRIGPGDVQWMTAARGIVHEEMHSMDFARKGGLLEMVQLWVNLPAKDKMSPPAYQEILSHDIPVVHLPHEAGYLRLIAGAFGDARGVARSFTPVNLWDMRLNKGATVTLDVPNGHHTMLLVLSGKLGVGDKETLAKGELGKFTPQGDTLSLHVREDAIVLLMSGEPINEPIVGHGPFVMNSAEEIRTALRDYATGNF